MREGGKENEGVGGDLLGAHVEAGPEAEEEAGAVDVARLQNYNVLEQANHLDLDLPRPSGVSDGLDRKGIRSVGFQQS